MTVLERLRRLVEPPSAEITVYECLDCGSQISSPDGSCPECGGRIEADTDVLVDYRYRGPHY